MSEKPPAQTADQCFLRPDREPGVNYWGWPDRKGKSQMDELNTTLKPGQIWREVDARIERLARILKVGTGRRSIQIRTVFKAGDGSVSDPHRWEFPKHSRPTYCDRNRFNGKRSGYELWEDVP